MLASIRSFSFLLLAGLFLSAATSSQHGTFRILDDSQLYLDGSSNVKDFTCLCENDFGTNTFQWELAENFKFVRFRNTSLQFPSKSLDCGGRMINQDMYETLKAEDYPEINITLLEAWPQPTGGFLKKEHWTNLKVKTQLTIANTSQTVWMEIQALAASSGNFRFKGSQELSLAKFCLEPPSPLGGLIKVADCVTIHLDLHLDLGTNG